MVCAMQHAQNTYISVDAKVSEERMAAAKRKASRAKKAKKKKKKKASILGEPKLVDLITNPPKGKQASATLKLVPEQQDVLAEMGHIGAGRASGELSKLTGSIVTVGQPTVEFFSITEPPEPFLPDGFGEVVVVFSHIAGETRGEMMVMLHDDSATALADVLSQRPVGTISDLSEDEDKRKLMELCADLCNRYLAAVSVLLGLRLEKEEYKLVAAESKAFSTYLTMSMLAGRENAIFLKVFTEFSTNHVDEKTKKKTPIKGLFIFLLEMASVIGMLKAVKERLETITL